MINNIPSLDLIEKMIDDDDLDGAAAALAKIEKVIKAAQPADDEDELDEMDDTDEEDEMDEDEEDDGTVQKLGPPPGGVKWPHDPLMPAMTEDHRNLGRDAQVTTLRTEFDDAIDALVARGLSRVDALQQARVTRPAAFIAWNQLHAPMFPAPPYKKGAPAATPTYEDAVDIECSKGFSPDLAAQRVLHQYGNSLPHRDDDLTKAGDTIVTKFMRQVDQTMIDECCDRTEAMRKVRLAQPELFEAFGLV